MSACRDSSHRVVGQLSPPSGTNGSMWGSRDAWDPRTYVELRHPEVRVEVMELQGRVQGCVDVDRRVIWIDAKLSPVQARCALAYEIGEYEQGPTPADPCMARAHQRAAQEWAALMLISSEEFVAAWANCLDLASMAARCGVDLPTFRARIRAASDAEQDAAMAAIANTRLSSA